MPRATPNPPGVNQMARNRPQPQGRQITQWEAAVAINPKADYTGPGFTQPMR